MESLLNAGEAYVLSLPFFPGRALVGGVAFLLVLWASCVCITPCKRVRRGRRCYGPCDIALYLLTRCPCLVFLGGICAPVYIGYLGLVASNYTVVVDIDFASYLTSTSYLKSLEDAYTTLVEQQPTAQKQNARMLFEDGRERSTWSLTLLYAIRPSKNYERRGIFQKEALEEIKWVEESIRTFADYERYCYRKALEPAVDTTTTELEMACALPTSPVNLFFSDYEEEVKYDGGGRLRDIPTTLIVLKQMSIPYFVDLKSFQGSNPYTNYTRTRFLGFSDTTGYDAYLKDLHDNLLSTVNRQLEYITVTWFEGSVLVDYEVNSALLHDSKWSIGSLLFVALFVLFHVRSPFLCFCCMLSILLAFPAAYGVFYLLFEVKTMMILNFVSLFLIMGIGADDAFICFDTFHQAKAIMGPETSISKRMSWAMREASSAMFITTFTTAGSFFSNCISTVKIVREFGLFMGSVVVFNYINMLTIFPAAIIIQEQFFEAITCYTPKRHKYRLAAAFTLAAESAAVKQKTALTGLQKFRSAAKRVVSMQKLGILALKSQHSINVEELGFVERCCYKRYSYWLRKARFIVPVVLTIASGLMGLLGYWNFQLHNGSPTVFQESENLGRINELHKTSFHAQEITTKGGKYYWGGSLGVVGGRCPGNQTGACFGRGTCTTTDFKCTCFKGYAGYDCLKRARSESLPYYTVVNVVVHDAATITSTITYGNRGDHLLHFQWSSIGPMPSWLSMSIAGDLASQKGTLEKCDYDKGAFRINCKPSSKNLVVALSAKDQLDGWDGQHILQYKTKRFPTSPSWNVLNVTVRLTRTAAPMPSEPTPPKPSISNIETGDGRLTIRLSLRNVYVISSPKPTFYCVTKREGEQDSVHVTDNYPIIISKGLFINYTYAVFCRVTKAEKTGPFSDAQYKRVLLTTENANSQIHSMSGTPWPWIPNYSFKRENASHFLFVVSTWVPTVAFNITPAVDGASLVINDKRVTNRFNILSTLNTRETVTFRGKNTLKNMSEVVLIESIAPAGLNRSYYYVHVVRRGGRCPQQTFRCQNPWTCDPLSWGGCICASTTCRNLKCNGDCSNNGKCNIVTGRCDCFLKYKGTFCQTFAPFVVPLKQSIKVTLLWGTEGLTSSGDKFNLDRNLNLADPSALSYIVQTMSMIKSLPALSIRNISETLWPTAFYNGTHTTSIEPRLYALSLSPSFNRYIGRGEGERVKWVAVDIHLNVSTNTPAFTMYLKHYLGWKSFVNEINVKSPACLGNAYMVSESWTKMDVTIGIIISTIESFVTSNGICFISVLMFTGDVAVSTLTMLSILLIVICLLGTLLGPIFNYTFGAIEAVGVTVFVGMSVDYALHVAHGYHNSGAKTRFEKVRDTLTHLGVSILGGALTTGGSAVFLLFCKIYFFLQLGTMMMLNTGLALLFALGWLCALLMILGPTTPLFSLYFYIKLPFYFCACVKKRIHCSKKEKVTPRESETPEGKDQPTTVVGMKPVSDETGALDDSDDEYGVVMKINPATDFI